ncbi:TetR/AcrR family transcriptional regulator [Myxococcus landrumensis]|uniref:TetR/AcrR family transcriptional regulator n=1 Tax=Myxococcus landrumensis TaxID=2813577 RepID=A0ABX7MY29_9BACT|nr:TetR/AcrR family transcriptional regulator [Myxococcus landrumus]QSQ11324.1 TetR/AcrR family transcriptional regulator [Myxococcus landrumus]
MPRPADPHARATLLTAARAEFARKGLRGARIEDITAACGLSKGAFYLHFDSKEALFGEVLAAFEEQLGEVNTRRMRSTEAFFREQGTVQPDERLQRSERYQRFCELERTFDVEALELMWSYRDVVAVLVSGSQGTPYESLLWQMTDAQVERLASDFQRLQVAGAVDPEMDPRLLASVIVGAYLLLSQRMVYHTEKPDLSAWALTLHRVFEGGTMPRLDSLATCVAPEPSKTSQPKTSQSKTSRRGQQRARSKTHHTPRKRQ